MARQERVANLALTASGRMKISRKYFFCLSSGEIALGGFSANGPSLGGVE
jgi:hypothetical protein